jgi:hypothetical protein
LRKQADIALGKTVIVTETDGVKKYSFPKPERVPPTPPRLSWLSGKTAHQHNPQESRSGYKPEHTAALLEDSSQTLAKEIEKAQREIQKENLAALTPATAPEVGEVTA